jgi:hypothetical protein
MPNPARRRRLSTALTHAASLVHAAWKRKCGSGLSLALALVAAMWPSPVRSAPDAADLEAAVRKHLHIFITLPDRRESGEGVSLDDHGELEIRYLRTLPASRRDAALCQGIRWLLLGRLAGAGGIGALFRALPEVQSVVLVYYELETRLALDAEQRYVQTRSASPRARIRIGREKGETLDPAVVDRLLGPETCLSNGRTLVDALWTN